jgi:uncharacterized protein (DUF1684 family)
MRALLLLITFISYLPAFSQLSIIQDDAYKNEIEQWHQNRVKSLKGENGWLNIVGLFWLKEGENTFGSSPDNDIVFPEGKAAEKLGSFILKDSTILLKALPNTIIQSNGLPFTEGIIYNEKQKEPVLLSHNKLRWFIIKRGTRYAVRLRDLESDGLKNFTHIDRFPVDSKWRINATYEAPKEPKTIPINDIIGLTTATPFGGTLHFEINGKHYQLDATLEDEELFIVFADETTGNETYGGGRFLYVKKPETGTTTIIDFNKAYNPPCCFTNYATCPLPPTQNRLAIAVTAGEKTYGHH